MIPARQSFSVAPRRSRSRRVDQLLLVMAGGGGTGGGAAAWPLMTIVAAGFRWPISLPVDCTPLTRSNLFSHLLIPWEKKFIYIEDSRESKQPPPRDVQHDCYASIAAECNALSLYFIALPDGVRGMSSTKVTVSSALYLASRALKYAFSSSALTSFSSSSPLLTYVPTLARGFLTTKAAGTSPVPSLIGMPMTATLIT